MKTFTIVAAAALLTACASVPRGSEYVPLVDMQGKESVALRDDLQACQAFARERISVQNSALATALFGALLGAAASPYNRNDNAWAGATAGMRAGGAAATDTQENIIKRCLAGRGWSVLN